MTDQKIVSRRYWLGGKRAASQDRFFREALDPLGWELGDADHWDAAWCTGMPDPAQFKQVSPQRKLNHFPGNSALTVKSRLHDGLAAMRTRVIETFGPTHEAVARLEFFPRVYSMPKDYHALQQAALEHPEKRWILKPKNASKGKGIRVLRDVADALLEPRWMVQEYLANPHTIRGHKYVLRLYVLVASIEPLRVYVYRQGFAKLASEPYDVNDPDNLYSQLTNPDINALNITAEVPVEFIDFDRYRQWLRDQGHDDERLFAQVHDLITLTVISAVDAMRQRTAESGADPRGCYELLGLDCLVDDTLKPWILECNLSPSMGVCAGPESGGIVEEAVKAGLVKDMVSLVGLDAITANASDTAPGTPDSGAAERLASEAQAELARAGDFLRLFPNDDTARYLPFFSLPRLTDIQLADGLAKRPVRRPSLQRWQAAEVFGDDDQLALYATHTGHFYRLNDTASLIWLLATDGLDPDAIAEQLALSAADETAERPAPTRHQLRQQVWDCLSEWCHIGLIRQRGVEHDEARRPSSHAVDEADMSPPGAPCQPMRLVCGGRQWALYTDSAPALVRLSTLLSAQLSPLPDDDHATGLPRLDILRDSPGYLLATEGEVVASRLTLAKLGPAVIAYLARQAASTHQLVIDTGLLTIRDGSAAICLFAASEDADAMAQHLASSSDLTLTRGLRLDASTFALAEPLGLPLGLQTGGKNPSSSIAGIPLPETAQVRTLIWVHHGMATPDAAQGQVSTLDILGALLPSCFTAGGKPLDTDTVTALTDWLSRCERHTVEVSDEVDTTRVLAESLQAFLAPQHAPTGAAATS
ncbi:PqqD family peptide modification chaperone [Litchfieldella rifensis]|uniref:PqqD family peptide modification chaperone n=1 Tax=Litchfieldella rifensis TaxID=762643 RepID=A0ABV7LR11_9GAMM